MTTMKQMTTQQRQLHLARFQPGISNHEFYDTFFFPQEENTI